MPIRRRPPRPAAAHPRTVAGLWLRALLMHDDELRDRLVRKLGGGKPGWNRDEAAVVQAVCDLAVRRYFGPGYDVRAVTEMVSFMRQAELANQHTPYGQLEMEAVIRHALGEPEVDVKGITTDVAFKVQCGVTAVIAWKSDFTESRIDELITEAEELAIGRGFSPPLATRGSWPVRFVSSRGLLEHPVMALMGSRAAVTRSVPGWTYGPVRGPECHHVVGQAGTRVFLQLHCGETAGRSLNGPDLVVQPRSHPPGAASGDLARCSVCAAPADQSPRAQHRSVASPDEHRPGVR
jgi:hypothetical protein